MQSAKKRQMQKTRALADDGSWIEDGINLLRCARAEADSIGCAVSFGKDSLATLDLCCRVFSRVEGYYLYRVPGLRCVDEWAEEVKHRTGVVVRMYPHFDLSRCYSSALLQPHWAGLDKTPQIKMSDIENQFRRDANVEWLAIGWRRNDSFSRALILKSNGGFDARAKRVYPLRCWRRSNVFAYLRVRGIPFPESLGRKDQGGLDFHPGSLAFMRDNYPDDYSKWLTAFPFSEIQLVRPPVKPPRRERAKGSTGPSPESACTGETTRLPSTGVR